MKLVLRAVDATSLWQWRWLLSDEETGTPLASHTVDLDPASEEVAAFRDLYGYARWRGAPDRQSSDQARIVAAAGAWAGRELLGPDVAAVIAAEAPVTVRVEARGPAGHALMWPLELAHAGGGPLAARGDVSLVYDIVPGETARRKEPVRGALRMLAVFSQPTRTSVLALRRERHALSRLIRRIAAREGAVVELRIVQYGVTRERFAEIADSADGWDVLHLAGHGGPGQFLLERDDGSPDLLGVAELIELLRPARHRLKLAVVSACESAADTIAETLCLVGLADDANTAAAALGAEPGKRQGATEVTGVARALVRDLECAVVAMRYPVTDEFAITLGEAFYEHLLGRKHSVNVAAARAAAHAAGAYGLVLRRALSLATPGMFGSRSAGLRIDVPRGQPQLDPAAQKMAHFPDEPERFAGRAQVMAKASAVLAPKSGKTTVLLHGMAGSGKTACALELAYRHRDAFSVVAFWQAPTRGDEWVGALADFASRLEIQLRDYSFTMTEHIGTEAGLRAFLPRLRHVMRNSGLLLVLDNLETLLTPAGGWLDPRWELLIAALTSHGGESRLIITSQIAPVGVGDGAVVLPVHALSLDESAALARELPHLRSLLHLDEGADGDMGPVRGPVSLEVEADRERLRRVLRVVQGHPKLLELADAAAADREQLDTQLTVAEQGAAEQQLEAFFQVGKSALDAGQFLNALSAWTGAALAMLPHEARLMAELLAGVEDGDRLSSVVDGTWPELWRELGRSGDPPASAPLIAALAAAALVDEEAAPMGGPGDEPIQVAYRIHPGVAAAIAAAAAPGMREAVDIVLAAFWQKVSAQAGKRESGEDSGLAVRAGLSAAPYLLRRADWDTASWLLEYALYRDTSPGTVHAALPTLRRIAAATGRHTDASLLARALRRVDSAEAEPTLRAALNAAARAGDNRGASRAAEELADLLLVTGRLAEALQTVERQADYTRRAGLGPWTQLSAEGMRLQVLGRMGQHAQVLAEAGRLRTQMAGLPDHRGPGEAVEPWNVRETLLNTANESALAIGEWAQCLELNAEIVASQRQRGAGDHEITRFRFNDASALIHLGRVAEAERLLADCQLVFERHADTALLAAVLSTRASVAAKLGHLEAAVDLQHAALRFRYTRPEPEARNITVSHYNLANYLGRLDRDPAGQRAHRLAAALIYRLAGMTPDLAEALGVLAIELRRGSGHAALPSTVGQVVETVEQTEGVALRALLAALQPDSHAVETALAEILRTATAQDSGPPELSAH